MCLHDYCGNDFLMRQVDGDSAFLVDPRCTQLKAAMMGGYRFHYKNGNIDKNKHSHSRSVAIFNVACWLCR